MSQFSSKSKCRTTFPSKTKVAETFPTLSGPRKHSTQVFWILFLWSPSRIVVNKNSKTWLCWGWQVWTRVRFPQNLQTHNRRLPTKSRCPDERNERGDEDHSETTKCEPSVGTMVRGFGLALVSVRMPRSLMRSVLDWQSPQEESIKHCYVNMTHNPVSLSFHIGRFDNEWRKERALVKV